MIIRNLRSGRTYEFRVTARGKFTVKTNTSIAHSEVSAAVESTLPRPLVDGTPGQTVPDDYTIMTCIVYELYKNGRAQLYVGKHCSFGSAIKSVAQLKRTRYPSGKPGYEMNTFTDAIRFWVGAPNEINVLARNSWFTLHDQVTYCLEKDVYNAYRRKRGREKLSNDPSRFRCNLFAIGRKSELVGDGTVRLPTRLRPIPGSDPDPPGSSAPSDPPDRYCPITNTFIPESECDDLNRDPLPPPPDPSDDPPGSSGPSDPPDRYCPITNTFIPESECDEASQEQQS